MKKIIGILLLCATSALAGDWVPIMYNTTSKDMAFGGNATNSPSTNMAIANAEIGNVYFKTNYLSLTNFTAWDDMLGPAIFAIRSGVQDISSDDTLGGQSYATTSTTSAANDHLTFVFQAPHKRKTNTDFHPHIHFYQTAADQTNCWFIRYATVSIGQTNVVDTYAGPASNVVTYSGGTMHQLAEFPVMSGTNKGISSIIRLKLFRDGTKGTGAITVTDVDLHIEVDGFGSDTKTSKSY